MWLYLDQEEKLRKKCWQIVLDEKNIQFKILSYLPFKLEGTLRNQQASQIHEKLIVRENYHFVNINKEVEKYPNIDLPELFKKMDQIGLEIMA